MKKKTLLLFVVVGLAGCTAPLEKPPARAPLPPTSSGPSGGPSNTTPAFASENVKEAECASLDGQHRTWGAIAKFAGVLAGAGGLTTVPISDDEKKLRLGIGLLSLAVGGLAAAAVYIEQDAAASWSRACSTP